MMNLYGSQGPGGAPAGGGAMSLPQLMAMIQGGQGGGQPPATPFQQSGAQTPMANYIGAAMPGGGMMRPPMAAPVAGNPGPGAGTANIMQILASLRGGQTGVAPQGAAQGGMNPGSQTGVPGLTPDQLHAIAARASPETMQAQAMSAMPIGAAGSPTEALRPPVSYPQPQPGQVGGPPPMAQPGQGQMNPAMMDWLRNMFSTGGGGATG